jgi:hypothetical protein
MTNYGYTPKPYITNGKQPSNSPKKNTGQHDYRTWTLRTSGNASAPPTHTTNPYLCWKE